MQNIILCEETLPQNKALSTIINACSDRNATTKVESREYQNENEPCVA